MFDTTQYKTRTVMKPRQNPTCDKYWGMAIDIGYSAVKTFSPNSINCFPSYVKKVEYGTADHAVGQVSKFSISYRDDLKKEEYFVGMVAQADASLTDASASMLYNRERYLKPDFKILARVGFGLSMLTNNYGSPGDRPIYVQTGLPPAYLKEDTPLLCEALSGHHEFSIKVGNNPQWTHFNFDIPTDHITVIAQPLGTLFSISVDRQGGMIPEARKYLASSLLVFDPGFGTLDLFNIKSSYIKDTSTREDLGMKAVLERTAKILADEHQVIKTVHEIGNALENGFVTQLDKRTHSNKRINFAPYLELASKEICEEALNFVDETHDYLDGYDYLVVTGGTGAAWESFIRNRYKDMETLQIICGNQSDPDVLPVFSNVRGYYMQLLLNLKKK